MFTGIIIDIGRVRAVTQGGDTRFEIETAFQAGAGVTALFGPSGAGKSTLLKMIAGTARPQSGRIVAGGRTLFDSATRTNLPPEKRGIGFVFQDARLFPHLSVRRNLTYARWAGRRPASRAFDEEPPFDVEADTEALAAMVGQIAREAEAADADELMEIVARMRDSGALAGSDLEELAALDAMERKAAAVSEVARAAAVCLAR